MYALESQVDIPPDPQQKERSGFTQYHFQRVDLGNGFVKELRFKGYHGTVTDAFFNDPNREKEFTEFAQSMMLKRKALLDKISAGIGMTYDKLNFDGYVYLMSIYLNLDETAAMEWEVQNFSERNRWSQPQTKTMYSWPKMFRTGLIPRLKFMSEWNFPSHDWLFSNSLNTFWPATSAQDYRRTRQGILYFGSRLPKTIYWDLESFKKKMIVQSGRYKPVEKNSPSKKWLICSFLAKSSNEHYREIRVRYTPDFVDFPVPDMNALMIEVEDLIYDRLGQDLDTDWAFWQMVRTAIGPSTVKYLYALFKRGIEAVVEFEKENKFADGKDWAFEGPITNFFRFFNRTIHYESETEHKKSPGMTGVEFINCIKRTANGSKANEFTFGTDDPLSEEDLFPCKKANNLVQSDDVLVASAANEDNSTRAEVTEQSSVSTKQCAEADPCVAENTKETNTLQPELKNNIDVENGTTINREEYVLKNLTSEESPTLRPPNGKIVQETLRDTVNISESTPKDGSTDVTTMLTVSEESPKKTKSTASKKKNVKVVVQKKTIPKLCSLYAKLQEANENDKSADQTDNADGEQRLSKTQRKKLNARNRRLEDANGQAKKEKSVELPSNSTSHSSKFTKAKSVKQDAQVVPDATKKSGETIETAVDQQRHSGSETQPVPSENVSSSDPQPIVNDKNTILDGNAATDISESKERNDIIDGELDEAQVNSNGAVGDTVTAEDLAQTGEQDEPIRNENSKEIILGDTAVTDGPAGNDSSSAAQSTMQALKDREMTKTAKRKARRAEMSRREKEEKISKVVSKLKASGTTDKIIVAADDGTCTDADFEFTVRKLQSKPEKKENDPEKIVVDASFDDEDTTFFLNDVLRAAQGDLKTAESNGEQSHADDADQSRSDPTKHGYAPLEEESDEEEKYVPGSKITHDYRPRTKDGKLRSCSQESVSDTTSESNNGSQSSTSDRKTVDTSTSTTDYSNGVLNPHRGGRPMIEILNPEISDRQLELNASRVDLHDMFCKLKFLADKKIKRPYDHMEKRHQSFVKSRLPKFNVVYLFRLRIAKLMVYILDMDAGNEENREQNMIRLALAYVDSFQDTEANCFQGVKIDKELNKTSFSQYRESGIISRGLRYIDKKISELERADPLHRAYKKISDKLLSVMQDQEILMKIIGTTVDFTGYKNYL